MRKDITNDDLNRLHELMEDSLCDTPKEEALSCLEYRFNALGWISARAEESFEIVEKLLSDMSKSDRERKEIRGYLSRLRLVRAKLAYIFALADETQMDIDKAFGIAEILLKDGE